MGGACGVGVLRISTCVNTRRAGTRVATGIHGVAGYAEVSPAVAPVSGAHAGSGSCMCGVRCMGTRGMSGGRGPVLVECSAHSTRRDFFIGRVLNGCTVYAKALR
jgi:hypothetical protein